MLLLGRPLVAAVARKAAGEGDFRYTLTRARENAETIALIGSDDDERATITRSFVDLARRWLSVIAHQTRASTRKTPGRAYCRAANCSASPSPASC